MVEARAGSINLLRKNHCHASHLRQCLLRVMHSALCTDQEGSRMKKALFHPKALQEFRELPKLINLARKHLQELIDEIT